MGEDSSILGTNERFGDFFRFYHWIHYHFSPSFGRNIFVIFPGQIITTSAEVTLNGGLIRELPQNPLNSGLGIILICPDLRRLFRVFFLKCGRFRVMLEWLMGVWGMSKNKQPSWVVYLYYIIVSKKYEYCIHLCLQIYIYIYIFADTLYRHHISMYVVFHILFWIVILSTSESPCESDVSEFYL